ncbi:MAG: hypothetical protein LBF58_12960 [Deltaproteobacteria bacterium]|nr:hypothetical protein [Deltaproteobacteria bacterium]
MGTNGNTAFKFLIAAAVALAFFLAPTAPGPAWAQDPAAEAAPEGEGEAPGEAADVATEGATDEATEPVATPGPGAEPVSYPVLAPADGKPTLVMAVPGSGHWASFGADAVLGAELALKNIGAGFELKTVDEAAPDFAGRLRSLGFPVAVMGHLYESSLAMGAPYYSRAGAPVLLTYIESPQTAELGPSFVRLLPDPASQGRRLAKEVPRSGNRIKQVYVLEGPEPAQRELAEAFRESLINPQAPAPTKANPKPSKPRAMKASNVNTVPINGPEDLKVLLDLKGNPKDWVLVALPPRLALRAAPILASSGFKRATFLMPTSLALREIGASYLAVDIKNAQVALPLDFGTGKNLNKALIDFRRRFVQYHRREPSWAAVMAYDAATLASLAASNDGGALPFLGDAGMVHVGVAGRMTLSEDGWPISTVRLDPGRLHWLP